ncbi:MAG: MBL fold metallo-hydrolase [Kangiellaceae bacterium]|nr:MBL fold metallo-hydrolase [Kangiellaceae bacterium]
MPITLRKIVRLSLFIAISFFCSVSIFAEPQTVSAESEVSLVVLGVAQDAGYPQLNCYKPHCMAGWENYNKRRLAVSLAIIDKTNKEKFLFEATPDIKEQLYQLHLLAPDNHFKLAGISLTHGHMGHYTGLMHLGKEAAGAKSVPVFAMPRMVDFLSTNGPWSQLVALNNIKLVELRNQKETPLNALISIVPLLVPHRDEYTEAVGYKIIGPNKTALFIPDIDKWKKWSTDIVELVKRVDYAFLDATFFSSAELPNRDMSEVPHPSVPESMKLFAELAPKDKQKIIFIHFNHSNPLLMKGSAAQQEVLDKGFRFATEGMQIAL